LFQRVLGIILPVFSIILLGYIYARRENPDMTWVNRINVNVLAPALIFTALASKDFDVATHAVLILGAIGVVAGSGLLAWPFAKPRGRVSFATPEPMPNWKPPQYVRPRRLARDTCS